MKLHHAAKPTLLSLRQTATTAITTQQLATMAGVSLGDAYAVEIGGFASETTAQLVLRAYEQLTGHKIRLNDIRINSSTPPTYSRPG